MTLKDSKDDQVPKSILESTGGHKQTSIEKLIQEAKTIGHDSVPSGTSELENKIQSMFDNSGKIMSAKEVFSIIKERDAKYYSDKLWYMRRAGKLVVKARGFYQSAKVVKQQQEGKTS